MKKTLLAASAVLAAAFAFADAAPSKDAEEARPLKVLVIGNSSWYYLLSGRKTENRFFYQLPPMEISDGLRDYFYEELRQKPSDWIALPGTPEDRDRIDDALGGLRSFLESDEGYQREEYDDFEIYIGSSLR